jgi:hypothetical protein
MCARTVGNTTLWAAQAKARLLLPALSVTTYKLNMERCEEAVKQYAGDATAVANFWLQVLSPDVGWDTALIVQSVHP